MPYDPADWDTADDTAKDTAQNFFVDDDGAHISTTPGDPDTGNNTMMDASGFYVRDGTVPFATLAQPTIIGKTSANEPNFRIGNVSPYGDGIGVFNGSSLGLWIWHDGTTGYIQSGDGCYLNWTGGGLYVAPFGQSQIKIADANRRSDFAFGDCHVYGNSFVKTVSASREITVFSNADVRSMFNVKSGKEGEIAVSIMNGDYGAQAHRITSVSYRSSSGWNVYLDGNASAGAFRFGYIVVVPPAASSI